MTDAVSSSRTQPPSAVEPIALNPPPSAMSRRERQRAVALLEQELRLSENRARADRAVANTRPQNRSEWVRAEMERRRTAAAQTPPGTRPRMAVQQQVLFPPGMPRAWPQSATGRNSYGMAGGQPQPSFRAQDQFENQAERAYAQLDEEWSFEEEAAPPPAGRPRMYQRDNAPPAPLPLTVQQTNPPFPPIVDAVPVTGYAGPALPRVFAPRTSLQQGEWRSRSSSPSSDSDPSATPQPPPSRAPVPLKEIAEDASVLLELFSRTVPTDDSAIGAESQVLISSAAAGIAAIQMRFWRMNRQLECRAGGEADCIVCFEERADRLFMPCKHLVVCSVRIWTSGGFGRARWLMV